MGREAQASSTASTSLQSPITVSATKSGAQLVVTLGKGAYSLALKFDSRDQVADLCRQIQEAAFSHGMP